LKGLATVFLLFIKKKKMYCDKKIQMRLLPVTWFFKWKIM